MIKMKFIFVITRCLIKMTFALMKQTNSIIQAFSNLFDYSFINFFVCFYLYLLIHKLLFSFFIYLFIYIPLIYIFISLLTIN